MCIRDRSLGEGLNTLRKTGRSGYWRVVVKNFAVRVKRRKWSEGIPASA